MKKDNAFTGLEAAIVLIAFVVVAAIFSYVMLGAGFFATQKAQEVSYAGIKQSISNAVIDGSLYSNVSADNSVVGFTFNVRIPLGGEAVDMNKTTFLYASPHTDAPLTILENAEGNGNIGQVFEYPACAAYPCYNVYYPEVDPAAISAGRQANSILTSGEFATYFVSITDVNNAGTNAVGDKLGVMPKEWFSLEMKPRVGAATQIIKTIASGVKNGEML